MPVKKYLAIDYGTKRIGLAVNFSYLVEPLFVLDNNLTRDEPIVSQIALESIAKLCREKAIEEIVLGLSEAVMQKKLSSLQVFCKPN
jgi:RNase H-fold protein (predicted Holliday junction resolvase)